MSSREAAVLAAIGSRRIDTRELAKETGLTVGQLRTTLAKLVKSGQILCAYGMWEAR